MPNVIFWQPKALRQLRRFPPAANQRIRQAVSLELTDLSRARNVRALTNHRHAYRLRVGHYRVFFNHDGAIEIISIEEVRRRDERTY